MLSEEKKAIEKLSSEEKIELQEVLRMMKREGIENFVITRKEYLDTVLNLITKQSNLLNKIEEYAKGMNDKELLLILKSNEIDELINRCKEGGFLNE